ESAEGERADYYNGGDRQPRAAHRDLEEKHRRADQHHSLDREQHEARDDVRGEILRTRHRRRDESLEQALASLIDDREAEPPDAAAHDRHAEQPGDDEVDVA